MAFDASFFALVGLVLFFVLIAYLKVPGMLSKSCLLYTSPSPRDS